MPLQILWVDVCLKIPGASENAKQKKGDLALHPCFFPSAAWLRMNREGQTWKEQQATMTKGSKQAKAKLAGEACVLGCPACSLLTQQQEIVGSSNSCCIRIILLSFPASLKLNPTGNYQ